MRIYLKVLTSSACAHNYILIRCAYKVQGMDLLACIRDIGMDVGIVKLYDTMMLVVVELIKGIIIGNYF